MDRENGIITSPNNIAYFSCGVGIRIGTISSGKLIRTVNDEEDVFGHMIIDIDGEECIKAILNKLSIDKEKRTIFSRGGHFKENAISVGASALVIETHLESGI